MKVASRLMLLLGALACGCTEPAATNEPLQTSARRVEMVNLTTRTAAVNPSSVSVEQLAVEAAELTRQEKWGRLQRLVRRYPDVALETLRSTGPAQAGAAERRALAAAYDRCFLPASQANGWEAAMVDLASRPAAHQAAFDQRVQMKALIEQGRFARVAALPAVEENSPPLSAEAMRLRGIALMLADQPAQAVEAWRQAREIIAGDRCVEAELSLLIVQAQRRLPRGTGGSGGDSQEWSRAAQQAAAFNDPIFWERLIDLKPGNASWPAAVAGDAAPATTTALAAEAFNVGGLWRRIAAWRLERGEAPAALLAYAQAQDQSSSDAARGEARIGQAAALLVMGQEPPAMAILAATVQHAEPSVSLHALALLGAIALQQGQTADGLAKLQRAVNDGAANRWPGYTRAQADLALALLSAGKESEGLQLLHEAQAAFERDGLLGDLCQCLANEAAWLDQSGKAAEAAAIRDRIEQIDSRP